jgi:hypothetical protein
MMMKCPKIKTFAIWCEGCPHELPHEELLDCKQDRRKYCKACVPVDIEYVENGDGKINETEKK